MDLASLRSALRDSGALRLNVKVVPKSARTELAGVMADGALKVRVAAPPEKGKANSALCAFLAREFGVPAASVTIESGATASRKRILILR
ncbi:MAG: DUF167 domain-containing protein [Bryobacteraceae bacterium]|nr:DUF167 domain-containing protein [Bryobacteraceae bacterium]